MEDIQYHFNQLLTNSIQNDISLHDPIKNRINIYILQKKCYHVIWNLLHSFSVLFPENPTDLQKENTKLLLRNIKTHIPFCAICSSQYYDNFIETSDLESVVNNKSELIKLLIEYHKFVNINFAKNKNYDETIYTIDFIYNKYSNGLYEKYLREKYNISLLDIINCSNNFNNYLKEQISNMRIQIIQEINKLEYEVELKFNIK